MNKLSENPDRILCYPDFVFEEVVFIKCQGLHGLWAAIPICPR